MSVAGSLIVMGVGANLRFSMEASRKHDALRVLVETEKERRIELEREYADYRRESGQRFQEMQKEMQALSLELARKR
ncbi:MAG: hypothetical protein ACRENP_21080 [Longimicrobiales bacterium]